MRVSQLAEIEERWSALPVSQVERDLGEMIVAYKSAAEEGGKLRSAVASARYHLALAHGALKNVQQ